MSSRCSFVYSFTDDKSTLSDKKALNSDIPDDGPALLLLDYDIVFVVSHPKFISTMARCPFRLNRSTIRRP